MTFDGPIFLSGSGRLPSSRLIASAWLLLFGCSLAFYWPFLSASYFLDDLLFFFVNPPAHLYNYLFLRGSAMHLYRPAEAMILTLVQTHFGFKTFPLHVVAMSAHATLCCLVWLAALYFRFPSGQAVLATALMFFSQVGAPALLGNDTLSQSASAALGTLGCFLLGGALFHGPEYPSFKARALYAASIVFYFCSLFFKETVLGFSLVIALLTFLAAFRRGSWSDRFRFAAARLAPYFLLTLAYFALRLHAGMPLSGTGEYKVTVGSNVPLNLAQFALVPLSPVSSVTIALAKSNGGFLLLVWAAVAVLFTASIAVAGLVKFTQKTLFFFLLGCILAALFPAMLLQHVSELYVYNAAPSMALLVAAALGALWNHGRIAKISVVLCATFLIAGQGIATRQKAAMMKANGDSAASMLSTIESYIKTLPPNSEMLLTQEERAVPQYSIYALNGVGVLAIGNDNIGPIYGRPDVKVRIIEKSALVGNPSGGHRLILELKDGFLRPRS